MFQSKPRSRAAEGPKSLPYVLEQQQQLSPAKSLPYVLEQQQQQLSPAKSLPYVLEQQQQQLSPAKSTPSLTDQDNMIHPAPWWKASMDNLRMAPEFFPNRYSNVGSYELWHIF
jgi:hypothetical protein